MLQRVQLMLDSETKVKLEKVANLADKSMSEVVRTMLKDQLKVNKMKTKPAAGFLLKLASKTVKGPGNSKYDEYAYET